MLQALEDQEGIDVANGGKPDRILLHIQLPSMDGYKVARTLRTNPDLKILNQYPQDTPARREQIRGVIDGYFDFEAIARLAMGLRWKSAPRKTAGIYAGVQKTVI